MYNIVVLEVERTLTLPPGNFRYRVFRLIELEAFPSETLVKTGTLLVGALPIRHRVGEKLSEGYQGLTHLVRHSESQVSLRRRSARIATWPRRICKDASSTCIARSFVDQSEHAVAQICCKGQTPLSQLHTIFALSVGRYGHASAGIAWGLWFSVSFLGLCRSDSVASQGTTRSQLFHPGASPNVTLRVLWCPA